MSLISKRIYGELDPVNETSNQIKDKLLNYYKHVAIASDFDGFTDPVNIYASPRLYPALCLYIANRIKWDLYRRYYNNQLSGFIVDISTKITLQEFETNGIIKKIMQQILDQNFLNQLKQVQNWT